jgi:hypothetical protein
MLSRSDMSLSPLAQTNLAVRNRIMGRTAGRTATQAGGPFIGRRGVMPDVIWSGGEADEPAGPTRIRNDQLRKQH